MARVLWAGRLEDKPEAEAFAYQASITVDQRMALDDMAGSRVHARMLGAQGIIPPEAAAAIDRELETMSAELQAGTLAIDTSAEDIHSFVESVLTERLGDVGRMVHAGRSRNDQVALDIRLYLKRTLPALQTELAATTNAILDKAEEYRDAIMPGYTHLQRAQPVSLGHHLCAWSAALVRDWQRLGDALARLDECPLGSGALAGTGLPLDRARTAGELGFARPSVNSMDAVADRDFALELASVATISMTHLSRFCEDIIIHASEEFGFISLAEAWSTGSSIMPQKKNPDFAELIRGKSGRVVGDLMTLVTLMKGLPYSYDKDMQEDKEALFDALDTLQACLRLFRGMISTASWRRDRMLAACVGGFLEATDVAEYLVKKGLPFRTAHDVSAAIVRDCVAAGQKRIGERRLEELRAHSPLFEDDIFAALEPAACVAARKLPGGPAPDEVLRQVVELRRRLSVPAKTVP